MRLWPRMGTAALRFDRYCASGVLAMTEPQDPAAGGDQLRVGHADREQVIEALKDAFADGRLTRDELGTRAGRALAARTCAELAALTAGSAGPRASSRTAPVTQRHAVGRHRLEADLRFGAAWTGLPGGP